MRLALAAAALASVAGVAWVAVVWAGGAAAEMTAEPIAVMQGLDKITARVSRFEVDRKSVV